MFFFDHAINAKADAFVFFSSAIGLRNGQGSIQAINTIAKTDGLALAIADFVAATVPPMINTQVVLETRGDD